MRRDRFPKWGEVTTAYHEGVPGHHLQVGGGPGASATSCRGFQRLLGFISGYGEGCAVPGAADGRAGVPAEPGLLHKRLLSAARCAACAWSSTSACTLS